jgi:hypothetical protein
MGLRHLAANKTARGKYNVIARDAEVLGDLRCLLPEHGERARQKMQAMVSSGNLPGTSAKISFAESYAPIPPTEAGQKLVEVQTMFLLDRGSFRRLLQINVTGTAFAHAVGWIRKSTATWQNLGAPVATPAIRSSLHRPMRSSSPARSRSGLGRNDGAVQAERRENPSSAPRQTLVLRKYSSPSALRSLRAPNVDHGPEGMPTGCQQTNL